MTKVTHTEATADSKPEVPPRADKQAIREAFLNSKPKSVAVTAFGFKIDVRPPAVKVILGLPTGEEHRARNLAFQLVHFVYVAGTDEQVFEPADADALIEIPFSEDVRKIVEAINEVTGVGSDAVAGAEKNS
ncbi:MAG: hypothetical protein AB7L09_21190 [Nitrospira sp.]